MVLTIEKRRSLKTWPHKNCGLQSKFVISTGACVRDCGSEGDAGGGDFVQVMILWSFLYVLACIAISTVVVTPKQASCRFNFVRCFFSREGQVSHVPLKLEILCVLLLCVRSQTLMVLFPMLTSQCQG